MVVLVGGVAVVAAGRCSWWGTVLVGSWVLARQAVVGVSLRVPVREAVVVGVEGLRRGAWWRLDGPARLRGS